MLSPAFRTCLLAISMCLLVVFHSFGSFSLDYAHDSGVHFSAEMFLQPAATGANSNCWSHQAWRRDWRTRTSWPSWPTDRFSLFCSGVKKSPDLAFAQPTL